MKCEDMRKSVEKKVKRWKSGAIAIIMAGIICGGVHRQIYAGEFGGFDIDIGGDGDTFDDWTEEPEVPQEPAKSDQSPNGGSNANSSGANNNNSTSSSGANNNSGASSSGANNKSNISSSGANNNSSANSPEASNNSSEGSQGEDNSSNEGGSWGNSNGNESNYGGNNDSGESSYGNHNSNSHIENYEQNASVSEGYYASNDDSSDNSSGEEKNENTTPSYALNSQPKTKSSDGTGHKASKEKQSASNTDEKSKEKPEEKSKGDSKEDSKEISPTAAPSVHKITALGTVFSAVGMAKISPELKFYNSNHENKEETQNTDENYNKTIYFHHAKIVPINEYPEIKLVKTEENQDVTILSLRLNGEETSWHQEGDTLILDEPIAKKTNFVELLAVLDGKKIVQMPVWTME